MNTVIRTATAVDADAIAGMVMELLEEIMTTAGSRYFDANRQAIAERCGRFLAEGLYTVLLAGVEDGGSPLGFVALAEGHALYAGGSFGVIPEFYVRPGFRSNGIGRALISAAREHGRRRGWTRLEVTTPPLPQFERSLQFYEAQGFAVTGGRKMKSEL